jgi:Uncharacterised protein family (UPF0175)
MHNPTFTKENTVADKRFEVELPEEVLAAFGWQDAEVPQKLREAVVMELLRLDRISEAQAATFLTLDRWALLETMGRYQVPAIRITPAEFKRELAQEIPRDKEV